jgi:hypothetical protein
MIDRTEIAKARKTLRDHLSGGEVRIDSPKKKSALNFGALACLGLAIFGASSAISGLAQAQPIFYPEDNRAAVERVMSAEERVEIGDRLKANWNKTLGTQDFTDIVRLMQDALSRQFPNDAGKILFLDGRDADLSKNMQAAMDHLELNHSHEIQSSLLETVTRPEVYGMAVVASERSDSSCVVIVKDTNEGKPIETSQFIATVAHEVIHCLDESMMLQKGTTTVDADSLPKDTDLRFRAMEQVAVVGEHLQIRKMNLGNDWNDRQMLSLMTYMVEGRHPGYDQVESIQLAFQKLGDVSGLQSRVHFEGLKDTVDLAREIRDANAMQIPEWVRQEQISNLARHVGKSVDAGDMTEEAAVQWFRDRAFIPEFKRVADAYDEISAAARENRPVRMIEWKLPKAHEIDAVMEYGKLGVMEYGKSDDLNKIIHFGYSQLAFNQLPNPDLVDEMDGVKDFKSRMQYWADNGAAGYLGAVQVDTIALSYVMDGDLTRSHTSSIPTIWKGTYAIKGAPGWTITFDGRGTHMIKNQDGKVQDLETHATEDDAVKVIPAIYTTVTGKGSSVKIGEDGRMARTPLAERRAVKDFVFRTSETPDLQMTNR